MRTDQWTLSNTTHHNSHTSNRNK